MVDLVSRAFKFTLSKGILHNALKGELLQPCLHNTSEKANSLVKHLSRKNTLKNVCMWHQRFFLKGHFTAQPDTYSFAKVIDFL